MNTKQLKIIGVLDKGLQHEFNDTLGVLMESSERILFCDYSEHEIEEGYIFKEIITAGWVTEIYLCRILLKSISPGYSQIYESISRGHKTLCRYEFLDGKVPDIINRPSVLEGWFPSSQFLYFR